MTLGGSSAAVSRRQSTMLPNSLNMFCIILSNLISTLKKSFQLQAKPP